MRANTKAAQIAALEKRLERAQTENETLKEVIRTTLRPSSSDWLDSVGCGAADVLDALAADMEAQSALLRKMAAKKREDVTQGRVTRGG